MRYDRALTLAALLLAGLAAPAAAAPGDQLFAGRQVHAIDIVFTQPAWWDSLVAFYEAGEERYLPATVVVNGDTLTRVGVRLKGNSSYTHPNDKKPFRLAFDEFLGSQRLDGLKGVHLNNCWRDPTFLREKLHLDFLREAGIPAPRGNFATVTLNGQPWGFYSLVEHVDKTFLSSRFGDKDGGFFKAVDGLPPSQVLSDFRWYGPDAAAYADRYEIKSDDEDESWEQLLAVLDTLEHSGDLAASLPEVVSLDRFCRAMAADNILGNLDAYACSGRNFYAYFDEPGGKMEWIAWDTGLSFGGYDTDLPDPRTLSPVFVYDAAGRPLLGKVLANPALRRAYLDAYAALFRGTFSAPAMLEGIETLAALARPFVQADPRKMYSNAQFEASLSADITEGGRRIPGLRSFVSGRAASIESQLAALEAPPGPTVSLAQNHPNPAASRTTIAFGLATAGRARLEVFDLAGRRVATLADGERAAGPHAVEADVSGLGPGLYFYRLRSAAGEATRRMIVLP